MAGNKLTVYDIAREAGVSAATVSRVLTGNVPVSEKTRQLVMDIVNKYDFKPSSVARSLKDRRSKTIGFIVPDITNPYFSQLYLDLETRASEIGYTVILCNSHSDLARESQLLDVLQAKEAEVIVFAGGRVDSLLLTKRYVHEMERVSKAVPLITCSQMPGVPCIQLANDEEQGIRTLVQHLAAQGHRSVGMIGGRLDVRQVFVRRQVLMDAAEQYGMRLEKRWLAEGGFSVASGRDTMDSLLARGALPTAIMAFNDVVAIGALGSLLRHGLSVPRDMALTGYDGISLTDNITPSITTAATNFKGYVDRILEVVQQTVEGSIPPGLTTFPMHLIARDSTAAQAPAQE